MLTFIQFPTAEIPNANGDPALDYMVKKMHDIRFLWNRKSLFSKLRHFPETHATPSL